MVIAEGTARDRAVGALLGRACGDAVGTTLELQRPGARWGASGIPGEWRSRIVTGERIETMAAALDHAALAAPTGVA